MQRCSQSRFSNKFGCERLALQTKPQLASATCCAWILLHKAYLKILLPPLGFMHFNDDIVVILLACS